MVACILVMLYSVMNLPVACTGSRCGGNVGTSDKVSMSAASLNYLVTLIPVNYIHALSCTITLNRNVIAGFALLDHYDE